MSTYFFVRFDLLYDRMLRPIYVSTLAGDPLVVDRLYKSCFVSLVGYDTWMDMIIFYIDFNVIWVCISFLYIIFLLLCQNCDLVMSSRPRIEWKGLYGSYTSKVFSYIRAQKLIAGGCLSNLAFIQDTSIGSLPLESISMVSKFMDVFPTDLPKVLLIRDIDLVIDVDSSTKPIPPYRMTLTKLKELND